MSNIRFKRWELALCIGFIVALLAGTVFGADNVPADKLIRLHVVARSDSEEDQTLKLAVRDKALELLAEPLNSVNSAERAKEIIRENIPALEEELNSFVLSQGFTQTVTVTLEREAFPTREYVTFSLPAGPYDALRIVLDEGEGQNWWCVVFPPLCASGAMDFESSQTAGLTDSEIDLITGGEYTMKFKLAEWIGTIKNKFIKKNK